MNIQTLLINVLQFLNWVLVPFLIAIAFLVFIWNVVRYFIIGGANSEDQDRARSLAVWSIAAFVIIISFWGIINMLVWSLGLNGRGAIIPDYMCQKLGGNCQQAPYGPPSPFGP